MKKLTYEESITRLREIVDLLEGGETTLEESMKLFEEGVKLSSSCYTILKKAEQKITQLTDLEGEEIKDDE